MHLPEGGGNRIGSVPMASRASKQPAGSLGGEELGQAALLAHRVDLLGQPGSCSAWVRASSA